MKFATFIYIVQALVPLALAAPLVDNREVDNPLVVEYCIKPPCYRKREVDCGPRGCELPQATVLQKREVEAEVEAEAKRETDNPLVVEYCIEEPCY